MTRRCPRQSPFGDIAHRATCPRDPATVAASLRGSWVPKTPVRPLCRLARIERRTPWTTSTTWPWSAPARQVWPSAIWLAKQGRRFVILEAGDSVGDGLARALGLAGVVHVAPLRRPPRTGLPWRSGRLSEPRRGGRLPRTLRRGVRAAGPDQQRGPLALVGGGQFVLDLGRAAAPARGKWWSRPARSRRRACPRSPKPWRRTVFQIHSSDYRRPSESRRGRSLVVGGGNTGYQIAKELRGPHEVHLAVGIAPDAASPARCSGATCSAGLTGWACSERRSTRGSAASSRPRTR